jgi:disulfide bond formation protein DsbB
MTILRLYKQKNSAHNSSVVFFWIVSFVILGFSFYQQYVEKIEPCRLCIWQRFIYLFVFVVSPIGLLQRYKSSIKIALFVIFTIGLFLSLYHWAIQMGWFADRCVISQKIENMNDFMLMLEKPKTSCAIIGWKFFGISISMYNAIFSFFSLVLLYFMNRYENSTIIDVEWLRKHHEKF